MNKWELYDKYKKEYNFRDGDCCATCKYGSVYHEEEMHCNRLEHIEVSHTDICDLFEKEEQNG